MGRAVGVPSATSCCAIAGAGELVEERLGLGGEGVSAVDVAVVQRALCLIEEAADLGDGLVLIAVEVAQGIDAALGGIDERRRLLAGSGGVLRRAGGELADGSGRARCRRWAWAR